VSRQYWREVDLEGSIYRRGCHRYAAGAHTVGSRPHLKESLSAERTALRVRRDQALPIALTKSRELDALGSLPWVARRVAVLE